MSKRITKNELGEDLEKDQTDLKRLDAMSDKDIDYSDIPALDDGFWKDAKLVIPPSKEQLTVRFDEDIIAWFRSQGRGYQTRMNAVLRAYVSAQENHDNQTR